eukprot:gene6750-biopygen13830
MKPLIAFDFARGRTDVLGASLKKVTAYRNEANERGNALHAAWDQLNGHVLPSEICVGVQGVFRRKLYNIVV